MHKPVVLVVLDGWGISESHTGNPILKAKLPTIEKLNGYYPSTSLQASGISVGLPWGEPGNSEVGHITLGTGRVIYQNMPRITLDIQKGDFYKNPELLKAIEHTKKNNSRLHLMGLVGQGSVHSYMEHFYALLDLAKREGAQEVFLHLFTDGRDSDKTSGAEVIENIKRKLAQYGIGKIATVCGRYFAMDRNNNWDRIEKAYRAMAEGAGEKIYDPVEYIQASYKKEVYDEHLEPAVVFEGENPVATISENDSVIFFNFREDRARQITKAFVLPGFDKFQRERIKNLHFTTMTQYEDDLPVSVAYKPIEIHQTLGGIISQKNMSQLRIAETEKFAHVTYFFNGGNEEPYKKEDRIIIPSNTTVATYDQAPEMKAQEVTEKLKKEVEKNKYDFILVNYANPDMVSHTGKMEPTIKALEVVDKCLGELIQAVLLKNGCLLITADHGNAEEVISPKTGKEDTEHSVNPVPLWFVTPENHTKEKKEVQKTLPQGLLSDIAPTVLELLEIKDKEATKEMTGESLLSLLV